MQGVPSAEDPRGFTKRAQESMAVHVRAMVEFQDSGAEVFDYGNSIRAEAQLGGFDRAFDRDLRLFFYMPFMHSEAIADQERCVSLFHDYSGPDGLKHAREHEEIVRRFGRFPHRNAVLGRHTTPAEQSFLDGGGFAG